MDKPSKFTKTITKEQKKTLVQYMAEHPQLNSGKFSSEFTFKKAKQMWLDLAKLLNAMPGCNKEWDKWRKTWHDLKNATKQKAAANKRSQNKTGGGISPMHTFDTEETKVLDILNPIQIEGLPVLETGTDFNFDDMEVFTTTEPIQVLEAENATTSKKCLDASNKKVEKKTLKRENRLQRLTHTIQATEKMSLQMAEKQKQKKKYYKRKLAIMKQDVDAKNRIAAALEAMAVSLSRSNFLL